MARKIRRPPEGKENNERWLLTYADMITLLMLFFIILYAMSSVNQQQYEALSQALASVFNGGELTIFDTREAGGAGVLQGVTPGQNIQGKANGKNAGSGGASALRSQATSYLQNLIKSGRVRVIPNERGFAISLVSDQLFGAGSADLDPEAMPELQEVSDFLTQLSNSIVIEGHTDNLPVDSRKWSSNWQLSATRAVAVVQALQDYGVPPQRLSGASFGDTRPVQPNDTAEGRALNRRVDVVIVENQ
jgi:chemotaxis protein MotB